MRYPMIMNRVFNRPLMVDGGFLQNLATLLSERQDLGLIFPETAEVDRPTSNALSERMYDSWRPAEKRAIHPGGIAMIDVRGALAHRGGFDMAACEMINGYNYITQDIEAAASDPMVKGILLDADGPGGEVSGNDALSARIRAVNEHKPVWAIVNEYAASATYALVSNADRIMAPQSAIMGSIGVVMAHVDMRKAIEAAGYKVTYIYAGDHKVDGNSTEPLADSVKADLQQMVNKTYGWFTGMVANNRGIQQKDVVATQARVFDAEDAVKHGLADEVMSVDDSLIAFQNYLSSQSRQSSSSGANMTKAGVATAGDNNSGAGVSAGADATFTQADVDAARSEGYKQGATAMQERATAILTHENAQGRMTHAVDFTLSVEMPQQVAIDTLGKLPVAASVATTLDAANEGIEQTDALTDAMTNNGQEAGSGVAATPGTADEVVLDTAAEADEIYKMARAGFGGIPHVS